MSLWNLESSSTPRFWQVSPLFSLLPPPLPAPRVLRPSLLPMSMHEKANSLDASRVMVDEERGYALQLPDRMEARHLRPGTPSHDSTLGGHDGAPLPPRHQAHEAYDYASGRVQEFWDRLRGKGRRRVGVRESLRNIMFSSGEWRDIRARVCAQSRTAVLNIFIIFVPFAWASHWEMMEWGQDTTFAREFTPSCSP